MFDLGEGELARALYGAAMLVAGFVLGRAWARINASPQPEKPSERADDGGRNGAPGPAREG